MYLFKVDPLFLSQSLHFTHQALRCARRACSTACHRSSSSSSSGGGGGGGGGIRGRLSVLGLCSDFAER